MPRRERIDSTTPMPRFDRATMPPARPASTLLLLYPGPDGELRLPLTVRNAALRAHAGEVSLPGGAVEEADASREATALRETLEEIGVAPEGVTILGCAGRHLDPGHQLLAAPVRRRAARATGDGAADR